MKLLLTVLSLTTSFILLADSREFEISSITMRHLETQIQTQIPPPLFPTPAPSPFPVTPQNSPANNQPDTLTQVLGAVDAIVATGERVYNLVTKGRPELSDEEVVGVSLLPYENGQPILAQNLTHWKMPRSQKYLIEMKNFYGITVIRLVYNISFSYGGRYNERGSYLAAIHASPELIEVSYGYTMDATFELIGLTNHGSSQWPIAGATFLVKARVKTIAKAIQVAQKIHVTGDGQIRLL